MDLHWVQIFLDWVQKNPDDLRKILDGFRIFFEAFGIFPGGLAVFRGLLRNGSKRGRPVRHGLPGRADAASAGGSAMR